MNEKILFVDDEQNVLEAYQRSLRKEFQIDVAAGGVDGLLALASQGPYAVVISDMRMPGMDGVAFLARAKECAPDCVRIMLTGNADQQTAINAVNDGQIFRFLTKPCPPPALARSLYAGLQQYRLAMAEKELLSQTLKGSIQTLIEILSLVNPTAFGRAARVRRLVKYLTAALQLEDDWQVEVAALLSQIGCITLAEETLLRVYRGLPLNAEELKTLQAHPQIGSELVSHIPRLEAVAEIIAYQDKFFNGAGLPHNQRRGQEIPLGARILKLALDFEKLSEAGLTNFAALRELQSSPNWYDPEILKALETVIANETRYEEQFVTINNLTPEMFLAEDINSPQGLLLIAKGQEVTRPLCLRLKALRASGAISERLKALVPVKL